MNGPAEMGACPRERLDNVHVALDHLFVRRSIDLFCALLGDASLAPDGAESWPTGRNHREFMPTEAREGSPTAAMTANDKRRRRWQEN